MNDIRFRAFRAIDDKRTCERFIEGHRSVLTDYGIKNITTNTDTWVFNPSIYGVIAESENGDEIYGGIRLQLVDGITPLPLEQAVGKMDPKVHQRVKTLASEGAGELCALWNSKKVAGMGVSLLLTRAGISIVNQVKTKILFGICGDYTLPMFNRVGFQIDRTVGDNGDFIYPKPDMLAWVLDIFNGETLDTADIYDRERMLSLRAYPKQKFVEYGPKGNLNVKYNLVI